MWCSMCGGPMEIMGNLGRTSHTGRCRCCGNVESQATTEDYGPASLDMDEDDFGPEDAWRLALFSWEE